MKVGRMRRPRPDMRRAVILFPSGLTLLNLFSGIFAIITAARGDFRKAGIAVVWGGIFDALDGRVARVANAGTQFGEELDSLVDAVSFGLAPAMIMYFAVLNREGWDWIFVFLFAACAVMRLARFNIEQAGTAKTYFQGLPSPAAGVTLASYYWFSQSSLYSYGAIGNLPWQELLRFLMAALAFLMISNIPYPVLPRVGIRSFRGFGSSVLVFGSLGLLATKRLEFFFPLCVGYVAFGLVRSLVMRLFERRQPTVPYDLSEGEDDEVEVESLDEEIAETPVVRPPVRERHAAHRDRPAARARDDESTPRERPRRSEAERAARREKRDQREKRDRKTGSDTPRAADNSATAPGVPGITLGETLTAPEPEGIVGSIPGDAEVPVVDASAPARARKKKRRRRRGERRPPTGADAAADSAEPSSSPYAEWPAAMPPIPTAEPARVSPPSTDSSE